MSKSAKGVEQEIARLNGLRGTDLASVDSVAHLTKALSSPSNLVAAKAASLVGEAKIESLVPTLVSMFDRFMRDPGKSDRGCAAKLAAAQVIYELGANERDLFLTGARHVQKEASWGPPVDTAATLCEPRPGTDPHRAPAPDGGACRAPDGFRSASSPGGGAGGGICRK